MNGSLPRLIPLVTLFLFESAIAGGPVSKCLVNGKTVYTDSGCPHNAIRKEVEMNPMSGVVSPDRDTVNDTINRIHDEAWANAVPGRSITRTTTRRGHTGVRTINNPLPVRQAGPAPNKKTDCETLSTQANNLDSMARQPQSIFTQDWIKGEKEKVRSAQFSNIC
jgi:hypothetical protein